LGELNLGGTQARGRHATLGRFEGNVDDLSLSGLAVVIPGASAAHGLVLIGDRVERLHIECKNGPIYRGTASVRHVAERGDDLLLGLELSAHGIDLGRVHRLSSQSGFSERLSAVLAAQQGVHLFAEYKAWVADLTAWLLATKSFLDSEELALADLDRYSREQTLAAYLDEVVPRIVKRMNAASVELGEFASRLSEDQHPHYRAYYRAHLHALILESPLLRRAFDKPLGYAGDYEMMNMLYREHAEGDSLFARALNVYGAQEPAAQANINRLAYLGDLIRSELAAREGRLRIASIGAGPAQEIAALLRAQPALGPRLDIALLDQEERAVSYCERTLGPLAATTGAHVDFISESVRRLLATRRLGATLGARDFVYSAGLFDYLSPRTVVALLESLYDALAPGGQLAVGNVAAHNPTRWFMEYCLDWYLIHRTPEALVTFTETLLPRPTRVLVDHEASGINLFLRVWK
jgi:extracellular factor (EF) 3-hydroxypalmitic acid methyl ester biosynthesis protein